MTPIIFRVETFTGESIILKPKPWDTVECVKNMIQTKTGVRIEDMRLIYRSKQLEDFRPIGDYKIEWFSTIHMVLRLQCCGECQPRSIFMENVATNELITLEVTLLDTIESVKVKIRDIQGISINQQRLTFDDKELKDGDRLMDCNIQTESILLLHPF